MDLRLTDEQLALRDATRRVLAERLATVVAALPEPPAYDAKPALRDAQALGWLGLGLPEELGGAGGFEDLVLVHEELGRGLAPSLVATLTVAGRWLLRCPGAEPLLERLATGGRLAGVAQGVVTAGQDDRLSGVLRHVPDAPDLDELLVPLPGGRLARLPLAETRLVPESSASDVPSWRVDLGDAQPAEVLALRDEAAVDDAVVLAAARAVGGGRAVLERTVAHVTTRHQFDRPIGTFQAVQHQLADIAAALDAAGLAVARAAWAVAAGQPAREPAAVAGLAAAEAFRTTTLTAHQLHGGMGFVLDSPLHLWSARAVADPTVPLGRRALLDRLADDALVVQPQHRAA